MNVSESEAPNFGRKTARWNFAQQLESNDQKTYFAAVRMLNLASMRG